MMRTSLLAISLVLSAPAYAQGAPAGDVPSKDAKPDAKADKDVVKASVEEDAQPVRRSIALRGGTLVTLQARMRECLELMGAAPFPAGSDELNHLEFFLAYLANGLPMQAVAWRPAAPTATDAAR